MRIDVNLPATKLQDTGRASEFARPTPAPAASTADAQGIDEAHLSGAGDRVAAVQGELSKIPDVRQDKVDALVEAMRQGTWSVSPEDIAGAMVSDLLARARVIG